MPRWEREEDRMKYWRRALLMPIVAVLLGASLGGCGGAADPEGAVRGVIGAIEAVDAEKADGYFTEDVRDQASLVLGLALALIDEFTVSNLTVQVTREGEETAAVDLRFDWEATALGATRSGHAEFLIDLLRAEGGWLIADFSPFEELLTEP